MFLCSPVYNHCLIIYCYVVTWSVQEVHKGEATFEKNSCKCKWSTFAVKITSKGPSCLRYIFKRECCFICRSTKRKMLFLQHLYFHRYTDSKRLISFPGRINSKILLHPSWKLELIFLRVVVCVIHLKLSAKFYEFEMEYGLPQRKTQIYKTPN